MSGKALAARGFEPPWGERKVPAFVSKAGTSYGIKRYRQVLCANSFTILAELGLHRAGKPALNYLVAEDRERVKGGEALDVNSVFCYQPGLCSKNSVNATSVTKSEISRFRSRRPLPPDPYCSAPTQPPPLAAAWPWQVIGKNAKLNRRRDTFVSEISEFRHRRRD